MSPDTAASLVPFAHLIEQDAATASVDGHTGTATQGHGSTVTTGATQASSRRWHVGGGGAACGAANFTSDWRPSAGPTSSSATSSAALDRGPSPQLRTAAAHRAHAAAAHAAAAHAAAAHAAAGSLGSRSKIVRRPQVQGAHLVETEGGTVTRDSATTRRSRTQERGNWTGAAEERLGKRSRPHSPDAVLRRDTHLALVLNKLY
ncbi:unnamed protein product [Lampetra planeri]